MALAGEPPRQDLQEVRGRAASLWPFPISCAYCGRPPPRGDERGEQEDAPHRSSLNRSIGCASLVAADAYRACNACRAVSPPLARGGTGRSFAAAERRMRCGESACNARFTSTVEACSGYRSNRTRSELSISSSARWQNGFDRVVRLLRSLVGPAEGKSVGYRAAGCLLESLQHASSLSKPLLFFGRCVPICSSESLGRKLLICRTGTTISTHRFPHK